MTSSDQPPESSFAAGARDVDERQMSDHQLRRELGLRDLIPMQILLVLGLSWPGTAAREGSTHVVF
jgi:hypothetical protein